jgi:CheY-like chemotaxis protein/anti-sigma regulatory factor (Ser/Thr protein kinase)
MIVADIEKISQAIRCLVENAIKFSNQKPIEIKTQIKTVSNNNLKLHVQIIDNGKGIAVNELDHIFDSFNQADNSLSRSYGGMGLGLGLTLARQIVEFLDGSLSVKSEIKKGSMFSFSVPIECAPKPGGNCLNHQYGSSTASEFDYAYLKDKKVLIVDDDEETQFIIKQAIEDSGPEIYITNNGYSAIKLTKEKKFDLILMDLYMSNINGLDTIKEIRNYESSQNISQTLIIAVSSNNAQKQLVQVQIHFYRNQYVQKI